MTKRIKKYHTSFRSPLYQVAEKLKHLSLMQLETIQPYSLEPWRERLQVSLRDSNDGVCVGWTKAVAVSSSARNAIVGVGGVIQTENAATGQLKREAFSFTLGARTEQNPFSGELAAMAYALRNLPDCTHQNIALFTCNKGAVAALNRPYQQSGQEFIKCIYDSVDQLVDKANTMVVGWDSPDKNKLLQAAKRQAKAATQQGAAPKVQFPLMKSTTLNTERRKLEGERGLPESVGKFSKKIGAALPGSHTREIYEEWSWRERSALAQLRTDMAKLNSYLHRIKAVNSEQCACGHARETVEHFLFECPQWDEQRKELRASTSTGWNDLSLRLGGKSASDGAKWKPHMGAVRATIRFTLATGRFDN